jgi:hypothetical protein
VRALITFRGGSKSGGTAVAEMEDRWHGQGAEMADPRQAPAIEERSEGSRAMAGAVVVLLLLVPAAFIAGWRLGRTVGRLRGY